MTSTRRTSCKTPSWPSPGRSPSSATIRSAARSSSGSSGSCAAASRITSGNSTASRPDAGISPEMLEGTGDADAIVMRDGVSLSDAWDQEWERSVLDAAIAQVRAQANPKHFQVFDYCVLKEWPVAKVASTLGMNAAQVYLARHRVSQAVKRAARRIEGERMKGRVV